MAGIELRVGVMWWGEVGKTLHLATSHLAPGAPIRLGREALCSAPLEYALGEGYAPEDVPAQAPRCVGCIKVLSDLTRPALAREVSGETLGDEMLRTLEALVMAIDPGDLLHHASFPNAPRDVLEHKLLAALAEARRVVELARAVMR